MSEKSEQALSQTPLLDKVQNPADLRGIPREQLPRLAEEIRGEIIRVVTKCGGHLASSLGAVELIIALHYVLKTPRDKIVFDVGHQTYAHKILTGRRALFESLRQKGGLSGFPKRSEGPYDCFDTGHSSTSVSAALGMACARDLDDDDKVVVAVLGDGALTGGMALEALNHAGALKRKLIVILNDNEMSISPNVGGLSEYMSLLVTKPAYVRFRKKIKGRLTRHLPRRGHFVIDFIRRIEEALKRIFASPSTLFETMGLRYLGPFDGHDVATLIDGLSGALNIDRPVLIHVITAKGRGYAPAEEDPCGFHGVGRPATVTVQSEVSSQAEKKETKFPGYSDVFGNWLIKEASDNSKIVAVTAAMSEGTGLAGFFEQFPERAFDVAIAEQHAVTLAAGLAAEGYRPVVAIYSSFLQRAFDQLFHDVALQNLPVILAVDRAGLVGEDGPTHHGWLDLSYLRLLPNFTVMAPADAAELEAMFNFGLSLNGPSAVRYPRGAAPAALITPPVPLVLGRGAVLREGTDISILALGPQVAEALAAAERLAEQGHSAAVVNLRFIKPLDRELVLAQAAKTGRILTAEENSLAGGLFGAVSEVLAVQPVCLLRGLGLTDSPVQQDSQKNQRAGQGLNADGIVQAALEMLSRPARV